MTFLLESVFNGMSIGAVLLLTALGLAIVFGIMGVINLAHGELMMLGAYTTLVVQNGFRQLGEGWFDAYLLIAVPLAFAVAAGIGVVLERGVIRYLYGRPLETLLATWGVSLILQQLVRSISWQMTLQIALFCLLFFGGRWLLSKRAIAPRWQAWVSPVLLVLSFGISLTASLVAGGTVGLAMTKPWFGAQGVDVTAPSWLRRGVNLWGVQFPFVRLFIIALTVVCLAAIYFFLLRSQWGLRIRAVTQNRSMSACLGIPTQTVDTLTFALGSGLAGVAGCAISLLGSVSPNTGQNYIVEAFMVVVVGGVGKIVGSIVAALGIGFVNYVIGSGLMTRFLEPQTALFDFFEFFASTSMARVMVFILIIAFLQLRPAGLFPQKGRMVDA
ncbi:ABC-type high affinity urea uptake system permease component UrtB [Thermosynechococcus sp. NK55a]|uniref:ABC transporter permease subunit n=1 Tax=unclassified Thermosynechococcus TaxID=2622553 RepID=UPI0003D9060A|nr:MULTISPECIES: branched-chain amino acid ABC transporter permease [unclassified Thermosynechococcus]AHB87433.1 ABC-type high affinity urea uptake system permease component UrtB [Thermosynechococcus sp. NK55a]RMH67853.1 MAG: branched-chain amino acid ABC transporter permease [Cyanobacteria bacterium J003]HIK24205.1 branched-chain amino acid ABC transporter permease [Thermosynechococcus sp. M3746_W2019_013]